MQILKKYLITVISITLIGELYFYPFDGSFRFSAGVVAFSLVIMLVDDFNIILLSIYTGLSVFVLRFIIDLLSIEGEVIKIVLANFPSAIYYILFGVLTVFFTVRKNKENLWAGIIF